MNSISKKTSAVKPSREGRHKGTRKEAQGTQPLEVSLISEWNSLFPDDPIREEDISNIDLIQAGNSSSPTSSGGIEDSFRSLYLADYYNTLYGSAEPFLPSELEQELFRQSQGDNSSRTGEILESSPQGQGGISSGTESFETSSPSQGDISSRKEKISVGSSQPSQGDNSSRTENFSGSSPTGQGDISSSSSSSLSSESFTVPKWEEEELRQFAESWNLPYGTVERAYRKLQKYPECGKHGGILIGLSTDTLEVSDVLLHPVSCNSIHCPYCQFRHSRKRLSELISYFKDLLSQGKYLTFVTLTIPSTHDIKEAVEKSKRLIEKFYQLRFRGKKVQQTLKALFVEELVSYTLNLFELSDEGFEAFVLKRELSPIMASYVEKAESLPPKDFSLLWRSFLGALLPSLSCYFSSDSFKNLRKVFRQLVFYSDFCSRLSSVSSEVKLGQYLSGVWKFELTYNPEEGYHPHWHGITDFLLPKLYLTAICRYVGFGEVTDIRKVKGFKGLLELSKYETKPWELPMNDPVEVLKRESYLHGFKKLRVWNMNPCNDEELPEQVFIAIPRSICTYTFVDRSHIRDLPLMLRSLRESSLKTLPVGKVKLSALLGIGFSTSTVEAYLDSDGDLHLPLDGKAYIGFGEKKQTTTIKGFAERVLSEFSFFLLRVQGIDLETFLERKLSRYRMKSQPAEPSPPSASSLSCSLPQAVYDARAVIVDFISEFQRYAGSPIARYGSYRTVIDELFRAPSYLFGESDLSEVATFLLSYAEKVEKALSSLSELPETKETEEVKEVLEYLLDRIRLELETILEVSCGS